ncbi:uncharacterized protein LOC142625097 [Castanea sativa]|uniref:uncharacterized protein LOC142625097 n=1 Tax=Castanea sativa TaxID=21020 RepID=UPI003F64FD8B
MADTIAANTSTTESSSSSQDSYNPNDPLFLHPRENPGAVLTSQPLIGGENYSSWARSVRKSLIAKNKLGFIDGSLTMSSPLALGSSTPFHQGFKLVLSTEILILEIWTDLRDTFSQGNGTKLFNIQKQIAEIHQGEQSLTDYFTQLKVLWDQLQNLSPFP